MNRNLLLYLEKFTDLVMQNLNIVLINALLYFHNNISIYLYYKASDIHFILKTTLHVIVFGQCWGLSVINFIYSNSIHLCVLMISDQVQLWTSTSGLAFLSAQSRMN